MRIPTSALTSALALSAALMAAPAVAQDTRILDSMDDASRWQASASTDVHAAVSAVAGHDGRAVRLDYDFDGKAGYAVLSRPLPFDLPDNYEISFWVRGAGPANTFEVKLTDASAENVWWRQTARYDFPDGWTKFVIKRRQVSKAWGPSPETVLRRAERVEFVVVAAEGGRRPGADDRRPRRRSGPEDGLDPAGGRTVGPDPGPGLRARIRRSDPALGRAGGGGGLSDFGVS